MPLSEDEVSLGDKEFIVPEDPVEQERFKRWLIATAKSLKKKQQQLQAEQDLLSDRSTLGPGSRETRTRAPNQKFPKAHVATPNLKRKH